MLSLPVCFDLHSVDNAYNNEKTANDSLLAVNKSNDVAAASSSNANSNISAATNAASNSNYIANAQASNSANSASGATGSSNADFEEAAHYDADHASSVGVGGYLRKI
jgi:hypothetical protein